MSAHVSWHHQGKGNHIQDKPTESLGCTCKTFSIPMTFTPPWPLTLSASYWTSASSRSSLLRNYRFTHSSRILRASHPCSCPSPSWRPLTSPCVSSPTWLSDPSTLPLAPWNVQPHMQYTSQHPQSGQQDPCSTLIQGTKKEDEGRQKRRITTLRANIYWAN